MDLAALKKEIKDWERAFRAKHNRDPSVDEIKQHGFADKYRQYKKLSKGASTKQPTRQAISTTRSVASTTQPLPGYNPFSPQKNNKGKQKELEFRLPAIHPDPFAEPSAPSPISRARKRLRGEPVSPSPNKGKRRRVTNGSDDDDGEDEAADTSFVDDSPVKPSAGVRSFKLLFDEKAEKPLFPSLRAKTRLSSPVRNLSVVPPPDAMEVDDVQGDPFLEPVEKPAEAPPALLIPPSPPPATRNSSQGPNNGKPRMKSSTDVSKKGKKPAQSSDESDDEPQQVRVFSRTTSRRVLEDDEDAFLMPRRRAGPDPQSTAVAETTSISLPDNLREILSLAPSSSRSRGDKHVVEQLIYGVHRSNYDPTKGGEVWGVGEFEGEEDDLRAAARAGGADDEEDDWEGEGVPWEVGEL